MANKDAIDLMVEEYKRICDEVSKTLVNRLTILGLGLAAIGVLIGAAVNGLDNEDKTIPALVLGIMVPAITFVVVFLWCSEVRRGRRASWYLWGLERRINQEFKSRVLRWEEDLRIGEPQELLGLFRSHYYVIVAFFAAIGGVCAYFGSKSFDLSTCASLLLGIGFFLVMIVVIYLLELR